MCMQTRYSKCLNLAQHLFMLSLLVDVIFIGVLESDTFDLGKRIFVDLSFLLKATFGRLKRDFGTLTSMRDNFLVGPCTPKSVTVFSNCLVATLLTILNQIAKKPEGSILGLFRSFLKNKAGS